MEAERGEIDAAYRVERPRLTRLIDMPYIDREARDRLDRHSPPLSKGELNFQITVLLDRYINVHGRSYDVISDAIAAANDAAAECRRRVLDPYEDEKIAANGDVYSGYVLGRDTDTSAPGP